MNNRLRRLGTWALWAMFGLLASCDQLVLGPGELEAKGRFESVGVGQTEAAVTARLGPPSAVFLKQSNGTYASDSTTAAAKTLRQHLPGFREPKILAYLDGSVLAYFAIGENLLVARRSVEIS